MHGTLIYRRSVEKEGLVYSFAPTSANKHSICLRIEAS